MQLPKSEKEANQLVINYLNRLNEKDYDNPEWQTLANEVFQYVCWFNREEKYEEHADALLDILLMHAPHSIEPILHIFDEDFNDPPTYKSIILMVKEFIVSYRWGTVLSRDEISEYIKDEYGN